MRVHKYRVLMSDSELEMEDCFNAEPWNSCLCFHSVAENELSTFLKIAEDYSKFLVFIPDGLGEQEEGEEEN